MLYRRHKRLLKYGKMLALLQTLVSVKRFLKVYLTVKVQVCTR